MSNDPLFFDFETCGFHGMPVLLQYAVGDGPIELHDLWTTPVGETLDLISQICEHDVVGFNIAFDWFHMQKAYSVFSLFAEHYGLDAYPEDHINEIAEFEERGRFYPNVCKPKRAMDLFLHARKGPYQSLMARKDIRIRRVPTQLAFALAAELEERVEVDGIYFSRRKDRYAPNWSVYDTDDPAFKDVVLKFSASSSLKVLAEHALKVEPDSILKFTDIEVPKDYYPAEVGWAPFAKAIAKSEKRWRVKIKKSKEVKYAWPALIHHHISHWAYNDLARKYGSDDVKYTRDLWHHFGCPEPGDDDSELACMVGAVRWRGFNVDMDKIKEQRRKAIHRLTGCPTAPNQVKAYLTEVMDEIELSTFSNTRKQTLESIAEYKCDCQDLDDDNLTGLSFLDFGNQSSVEGPCKRCGGAGVHPAAKRAQEVLSARKAGKEVELYDKIIQAGRFHASFKVIGTLSSRMSGSDGLNAQGINHKAEIRECFDLADNGFILCGGDFDSFEVVLADAAYDDEQLRKELTSGKKIHALFGVELSGQTYDQVCDSKGTDKDWYSIGKAGVFAMIYGGDWNTLVQKQGINPEVAQKAERGFVTRFPGIQRARQKINDSFCSMRQPGGIGSKVIWNEPDNFVESLMGFRRYFTLENQICKALFWLANRPPKPWKQIKVKCRRRDRDQYLCGALSSALYGAAFGIQSANMRAAANHVIQSSGATITKNVQRRIWDIQPNGCKPWMVVPMNVHDELMVPCRPEVVDQVKETVLEGVESFRPKVPLIKMDWATHASSWAAAK